MALQYIKWFNEVGMSDVESVGGKNAFYTIFLAATVVPAYGEQGYKYYDCSVGGSKAQKHKERLHASMGLKALGEFGMWRVFMSQEVASGGESLYVTQAVVKTH